MCILWAHTGTIGNIVLMLASIYIILENLPEHFSSERVKTYRRESGDGGTWVHGGEVDVWGALRPPPGHHNLLSLSVEQDGNDMATTSVTCHHASKP